MPADLNLFEQYGIPGIALGASWLVIRWVVKTWREEVRELKAEAEKALAEKDKELRDEREAHERTRVAHLTELRNMMKLADSVDEMRKTLSARASERNAA